MGIRNGFDRPIDRVAANIDTFHRFFFGVFCYEQRRVNARSFLSLVPFDNLPSLLVPSCRNRVSQILKDPSEPDETNRSVQRGEGRDFLMRPYVYVCGDENLRGLVGCQLADFMMDR